MGYKGEKTRILSSTTDLCVLIRVGRKDDIISTYINDTLYFSCPANWIDFALKHNDQNTGDCFECAFLRTFVTDPYFLQLKRKFGDNMMYEIVGDGTCFACFIPSLFTPTICFYSLKNGNTENLRIFAQKMNCPKSAALVILDSRQFIEDLYENIVSIIPNLSTERYKSSFSYDNLLFVRDITYVDKKHSLFSFDMMDALFMKDKSYSYQHETRMIIPYRHFHNIGIPGKPDYMKCSIMVHLPRLKNYAKVFEIDKNLEIKVF